MSAIFDILELLLKDIADVGSFWNFVFVSYRALLHKEAHLKTRVAWMELNEIVSEQCHHWRGGESLMECLAFAYLLNSYQHDKEFNPIDKKSL